MCVCLYCVRVCVMYVFMYVYVDHVVVYMYVRLMTYVVAELINDLYLRLYSVAWWNVCKRWGKKNAEKL